jgi:hypothetical protein
MKEDLQFEDNQLVNIQAMYTAGVAIGGIPLIYLLPRFPVNWTIPALELGWGVFTLLQYRTTSYAEIRAYRFFVGVFEVLDLYSLSYETSLDIVIRPASFLGSTTCLAHGIEPMNSVDVAVYSIVAKCLEISLPVCFKALLLLI